MDDELKNFRETVLTRLRERDRRCEQFHRIFTSCKFLSSFENNKVFRKYVIKIMPCQSRSVTLWQKKGAQILTPGQFKKYFALCGNFYFQHIVVCFSTSSIEVESLKNELSDVYRKKAINDQQLIETNKKLEESEKKVAIILREYRELRQNKFD